MRFEKIILDKNNPNVYIDAYIADVVQGFTRKAMLVIPGGAYKEVCSEREGEPIAMAFIPYGYNAFVLHYSVDGDKKHFPSQLIEASMAIRHIKDNAEAYNIDAEKIFACGFSAGGHLCGSLATMWDMDDIYTATDMPYGYNKPTGVILCYPVVNYDSHIQSFENLLGKTDISQEEKNMCSIDCRVSESSVPMFIMHTSNDEMVDVRGSLSLAAACKAAGKKFELHIYPDGPHGVALGNEITKCGNEKYVDKAISEWVNAAAYWAENICK